MRENTAYLGLLMPETNLCRLSRAVHMACRGIYMGFATISVAVIAC